MQLPHPSPSVTARILPGEGEDQVLRILESISDAFCAFDAEWRIVFLNAAARRILAPHVGGDAATLLGRNHWECFPGARGTIIEDEYGRAIREGVSVEFDVYYEEWQTWFSIQANPVSGGGLSAYFRDVTAEKAREAAEAEVARLQAEKGARIAELETLLGVLPIGIGIATDRGCSNIRLNPALARLLGLPPQANGSKTAPPEQLPRNFQIIDDAGLEVPPDELPMQVAAREGRPVDDIEFNLVRDDGSEVRLLEYAAPVLDEQGVPRGAVGAFVDITERRLDEERHRFLVRLDDAVRPLSDPGEIVATAARLLGEHMLVDRCAYADVEADEDTFNLTGDYCRGVPSIVGRYTFAQFGTEVLQLMRANAPFVVEDIETHQPPPSELTAYRATLIRAVICVPLHKAGKFVAAMAVHQTTPRRWTTKEVALVLHVANRCWEALERARVTRVLAESEERFRTLADNIPQLAWMGDATGWLFWYNRRWIDYTGLTAEEMQGWGWQQVHDPAHMERVVEKWQRHLEAGLEWEDTFPLRGGDGRFRWFLSRAVPIRDAEGKVLRWFGTNTDITEQRLAAEALAAAKEQAEAASRAKDEFLAALSHELRTPLTPVLLAAEDLCGDPRLPAETRDTLSMMRRNIALEARLIDDLLDLTRIARNKLALREQDCEAHALLGLALEIVREEAQEKGIELVVQLGAADTYFRCDTARLQQLFWNLLKNAIKFTPRGGRVTISSHDEDARFVLEVADTGIGIAADALERIFLPFEQAGLANDHRYGGMGLGLYIARVIATMHGGAVFARSAGPGQGAVFRVELPAQANPCGSAAESPAAPESATVESRPMRLLLVEDHEPTLAILSRLLLRDGHDVTTASTLHAARALAGAHLFDGVVSDIGLPDGTGLELMQALHTAHGLRGIALSGYGMEEDLRRSSEVGFITHLVKPVDFAQLRRALGELAGVSK